MSKDFTKEDVIQNKKSAIKSLNKFLEGLINSPNDKHLKKANLISYWIKDYIRMVSFEEKFEPTKNIAYKRGNIVKLNFGFNIGSEYGGLHYGVVLDKENAHSSPVLTVIPLTSKKDSKKIHPNSVELGNGIYRSLKIKYDTISKSLKSEEQEIFNTIKAFEKFNSLIEESISKCKETDNPTEFSEELNLAKTYLNELRHLNKIWSEKEQHNSNQQEALNKIGYEINRMKEGSIALVNQITTVSKIRIFDPRNLKGVLSGISLTEEEMEKINQKIKELYVFQ